MVDPETHDTVIIGGGQAGLATSHHLMRRGREHVVLERHDGIGETWRRRWESFTLVTPNWQLRLPGFPYEGDDPDGFMSRDQVVGYLEDYADSFDPPLRTGVNVLSVEPHSNGFLVRTDSGDMIASHVVIATGTFHRPRTPGFAAGVPETIDRLHSSEYTRPGDVAEGAVLVVGSGQSGCQIAQELRESGRDVFLSVGSAGRIPRRYRGRDGMWWAIRLGMVDRTVDDLDTPDERFAANPQISGRDGGREIDLHQFARDGIRLLGRLEDIRGGEAVVADDLHDNLGRIDTLVEQFRRGVDAYVAEHTMDVPTETVDEPKDGHLQPRLTSLDLTAAGVETVLFATGYQWDYESWVKVPVFDHRGYPEQDRGVTGCPGLYFVGVHWLHTLKSGLFLGVGDDAAHVADHIDERSSAAAYA